MTQKNPKVNGNTLSDTVASKAWTLSLSPEITLRSPSALRRESFTSHESWRILKNLIFLGIAFALLFTAFMATANLQSSVNQEENLGVYSLACIYGGFIVSSLFLPPLLLGRLKTKGTLMICLSGYITYIAAQYMPRFETLIPASLLIGTCASGLWASQGNYVTKIAEEYGALKGVSSDVVGQWFFGFFFFCFHSSQVWGNLISSFVLSMNISSDEPMHGHTTECGAQFCPATTKPKMVESISQNETVSLNSTLKPEMHLNLLTSIFLGSSILAAIVIFFGVDSLSRYGENESRISERKWYTLLVATVRHWAKPSQLLLIPLGTWLGIQEAFIGAEFTASFVSCGWGVHHIGFVMTAFGVSASISSFLLGKFTQYVGRMSIFMFAALANLTCFGLMLYWSPNPAEPLMFYLIAGIWGLGDGVWSPQTRAIYGAVFQETREAAFSNSGLWLSVGFIIVYVNAAFLCMRLKIYIYIGFLVFTVITYGTLEIGIMKEIIRS